MVTAIKKYALLSLVASMAAGAVMASDDAPAGAGGPGSGGSGASCYIDRHNGVGETALYAAVGTRFDWFVDAALNCGANPNTPNANGDTALPFAARLNGLDMVRLLLARGAGVNHVNAPILDQRGEEKHGAWSALHWAAQHKNLPMMTVLLGVEGVEVDVESDSGETPLMVAAYGGFFDGAKLLLENGANIHAKKIISEEYFTPLDMAAGGGFEEIVKLEIVKLLLVNGAQVDRKVIGHAACEFGSALVGLLQSWKAKVAEGKAPKDIATSFGWDIATYQIEDAESTGDPV